MGELDGAWLVVLIGLLAALYAAVGHGGASGYLAAFALLGVAPETMKPAALALNVLVAGLATVQFARAGHFAWGAFWPFAATSVPMAFVGGWLTLPGWAYQPLVAAALLWAGWRLARRSSLMVEMGSGVPAGPALGLGAGLGLVSGLTGVGGGIFLSPILLLVGWSSARQTAVVSAAFVLVNSAAGLAGHVWGGAGVPGELTVWAPVAMAGGWAGATLGSHRLAGLAIRRLLAVVLVLAAVKMLLM